MPKYADAIGYLRELGHTEGVPWLEMVCDLSASGETALSPANLEILAQLFIKRASYLRQPAPTVTASSIGPVTVAVERLQHIGPFSGFKRLGTTLVASFPKRVTIIFGANGSGKSSMCEALQILASSDAPTRPLRDVRANTATTPSFGFKFASDATDQRWMPVAAYGTRSGVLKYFDTGIAIHNVKNTVEPSRIIELSPFKLDVFEAAKNHSEALRTELQKRERDNATLLASLLEEIRSKFKSFEGSVLANLDNPSKELLEAQIVLGDNYSEGSGLDEKLVRRGSTPFPRTV